MDTDTVYIKDFIKFYLGKIVFVILITAICFVVSNVHKNNTHSEYYQEYASIMLGAIDEEVFNPTAYSLNQSLIRNYVSILSSDKVINNVIKELDLKGDRNYILRTTSFSLSSDMQVLTISANSFDDEMAAKIVNSFVKQLRKEVYNIYNLDNIIVMDEASPTDNKVLYEEDNVLIVTLSGFIVSSIILLVIFLMNSSLRNKLHGDSIQNIKLLDEVKYVIKTKLFDIREYNLKSLYNTKRLIYKLHNTKNIKTILFTSFKTKYSANLILNLGLIFNEKKVLVINTNPTGKIKNIKENGLLDVINSSNTIYNYKLDEYIKHYDNLNLDVLLLGDTNNYRIEDLNKSSFELILGILKDKYDLILIDGGRYNSFETTVLLDKVDSVILNMNSFRMSNNNVSMISKELNDKVDYIEPISFSITNRYVIVNIIKKVFKFVFKKIKKLARFIAKKIKKYSVIIFNKIKDRISKKEDKKDEIIKKNVVTEKIKIEKIDIGKIKEKISKLNNKDKSDENLKKKSKTNNK